MIREACERDLSSILDITNIEIRTDAAHFGTEPLLLDDLRCEIESARGRYPWVVCETNSAVTGFAKAAPWKPRGAYAWTAEIGVYIAAEHRERGVGRALYKALFPRLRGANLRTIVAGIALPNPASVRLHEVFGMRHVGTLRRMGFKLGQWRDVGYWQVCRGEPEAPPGF